MTELPYTTLAGIGRAEIVISKSRFAGVASPVDDEEAALRFLAGTRAAAKDASHNVYAYVVGRNAGIMRYSDDGEPQGTAGLPVMDVLRHRKIVNAAVVVTRWFGGVLLGAGGLARAYGAACAAAVDAARAVVMRPSVEVLATVGYPLFGRLERALDGAPCVVLDKSFGADVTLTLLSRAEDAGALIELIASATDGRAQTLLSEDVVYSAWEE